MRIYLIGFMGCGKSSLGRRLARKIDYPFIDIDRLLEEQSGMKVEDIFKAHGEDVFRNMEQKALHATLDYDDAVIATGGGTPCFFDNMDFMLTHGKTVYLRMDVTSLAHRLEASSHVRPLVQGLYGKELVGFIRERLKEREQWYLRSNCIVKGETVKSSHIVSLLFGE